MHFSVFVDRLVDDRQQPGAVQRQDMFVQIAIAALRAAFAAVTFEQTRNFAGPRHRRVQRACASEDISQAAIAKASASRSK